MMSTKKEASCEWRLYSCRLDPEVARQEEMGCWNHPQPNAEKLRGESKTGDNNTINA